ncbi:MAG: radical SAM protein [Candidatus Paceibacter sp.]|nr:radical SAM protein [Candidatus Paceibacter sp.]
MNNVAVTGGIVPLTMSNLEAETINNPDEKACPFVTLSLTKKCPFRCLYCGEGGEGTISNMLEFSHDWFREVVDSSVFCGVKKIRFTGGEPLVYKNIDNSAKYVLDSGITLLINTNGLFVNRFIKAIGNYKKNLHIAVSLDSLKEKTFDKMSSTRGLFQRVIDNIIMLKELGLLLRINMVVTQLNVKEVPGMVNFCCSKGINLKLQEVVCVPIPFGSWPSLHVPLESLDLFLEGQADEVFVHSYSRSHGVPVKVYRIGSILVTNKSLAGGSHYDVDGVCKKCPHYPCHEGLYDLYVLPDRRVAVCRWHTLGDGDILKTLDEGKKIFMRSSYVKRHLMPMCAKGKNA